MLTQNQVVQQYKEQLDVAPVYFKFVQVQAYEPSIPSEIATILPNGHLEGVKVAYPGENYVVVNPGGEQYVVGKEEFEKNYVHKEGFIYNPKGEIRAVQYTGPTTKFEANWGIGTLFTNDWLVCRPNEFTGIWHVGGAEFPQTYAIKS